MIVSNQSGLSLFRPVTYAGQKSGPDTFVERGDPIRGPDRIVRGERGDFGELSRVA